MLIPKLYSKMVKIFSEEDKQETNSTETGEETDPKPEPESPEASSGVVASISIPFILMVFFN